MTRSKRHTQFLNARLPTWFTDELLGLVLRALLTSATDEIGAHRSIRALFRVKCAHPRTRDACATVVDEMVSCLLRIRSPVVLARCADVLMPSLLTDTARVHQLVLAKGPVMIRILRGHRYRGWDHPTEDGRTLLMRAAEAQDCLLFMHLLDRCRARPTAEVVALLNQEGGDERGCYRAMRDMLDPKNRAVRRAVRAFCSH